MKPFAVLLLTLCAGLLSACKPASSSSAPSGKPRVALVMKSLANEFFQTMAEGAKKHQAAHAGDYELLVNGIKNETDLAEQVGLVDQMVSQGVQAIVIAPADSKALVTVLKRAKEAGVLVINIDNKLDADTLKQAGLSIPFVGPDNRAGAKAVGEVLAKKLKMGDEVAIIAGFGDVARTVDLNVRAEADARERHLLHEVALGDAARGEVAGRIGDESLLVVVFEAHRDPPMGLSFRFSRASSLFQGAKREAAHQILLNEQDEDKAWDHRRRSQRRDEAPFIARRGHEGLDLHRNGSDLRREEK